MQSSNAPNKISLPFAASGTKNTIPVPSQQGVTPGAASFTDGFPPLTFTPLSAGGVPPAGADFNGVLNAITAVQQWQSAGGCFQYDSTLSTAIGGYPKGSVLLNAAMNGYWISTAENNTTNPDTGGAGWVALASAAFLGGSQTFIASGTFTVPAILSSGARQPWVEVIGGGGGGGCHPNAGGGGGAGGAFAAGYVNLAGVSSVAVTIGAGGLGAPGGSSAANGTAGGTSSFGSYMSAPGGGGANNWNQGVTTIGVGGAINTSTGVGGNGATLGNVSSSITQRGGTGGGAGGIVSGLGNPTAGGNGTGPGGGGAGGTSSGTAGGAGGNGAAGIVIVRW